MRRQLADFYGDRPSLIVQKCGHFMGFTRRNTHIASYGNSVRPSVCLSVRLSVTRRYCVKTTARSTVQFALSDSKMCLVL